MSYHEVIIEGRLASDPEMRYTQEGTPVAGFAIYTNENYVNKVGFQVNKPVLWQLSAWAKLAETVKANLRKNSAVLVRGRIQATDEGRPETYEAKDGTVKGSFRVRVDSIDFIADWGGEKTEAGTFGKPEDETIPVSGREEPAW